MLVWFRGFGDWLFDSNEAKRVHAIKADDRGTYENTSFHIGYRFYRECDEIEGVFKLSPIDEKTYQKTKSLQHVSRLLPCSHPDSAFIKMVKNNKLSEDIFDCCYFEIVTNKYRRIRFRRNTHLKEEGFLRHTLVPEDNETRQFITAPNNESINYKRLSSLKNFIAWLKIAVENNRNAFDPFCLDCTKDQLFDHLRCWEKKRETNPKKRVWDVAGWNSCKGLWNSQERKDICDVAGDRRGKEKIESAYKKLLY